MWSIMCKLPAMCVLLFGFHSDSFMTRLKMYGQIALLCEFSLSLIASILNTFMYRLNMSCQITLLCSLMATLTTNILETFMCRLNMSHQTTILCKLFPTLITTKEKIHYDYDEHVYIISPSTHNSFVAPCMMFVSSITGPKE